MQTETSCASAHPSIVPSARELLCALTQVRVRRVHLPKRLFLVCPPTARQLRFTVRRVRRRNSTAIGTLDLRPVSIYFFETLGPSTRSFTETRVDPHISAVQGSKLMKTMTAARFRMFDLLPAGRIAFRQYSAAWWTWPPRPPAPRRAESDGPTAVTNPGPAVRAAARCCRPCRA